MSTCVSNHGDEPYPTGYNSCWEWVASLPAADQEAANSNNVECTSTNNETILAGSDFVPRKKGIQGLGSSTNGARNSTADIYQLAQATRMARERHSVVSVGDGMGEKGDPRALMLRTAFAAQRVDRNNSEGTYSFDSSVLDGFGYGEEENTFQSAEEFLLELGFGGPSHGLERVPERFLQSSQMRGVDIENFFAAHQEMDDTFETGSMAYNRGITGPPSRRPSNLAARLYERMLRKNSGPQTCSSFENPPPTASVECLTLKIEPDAVALDAEDAVLTPTNPPSSLHSHPLITATGSATSSRRSSLRRQECLDHEEPPLPVSESPEMMSEHNNSSGGLARLMASASVLPTVYVTPPPSTIFSQASLDLPESVTTHEIDPIIAVLQLAAEAYRVRLERPEEEDRCDWNHNLDVKEELCRELDKTDDLLRGLQQRLSHARSMQQSYDSSALRGVLADMTTLLQLQQRLYRQVSEFRSAQTSSEPQQLSSLATSSRSVSTCSVDPETAVASGNAWLKSFERRLTAQIRRTVRHELRRVKPTRSKLKKSN